MTLSYEDIFSSFLGYVTDYDFVSMSNQDVNDEMTELLRKAASKPYIRRLFSTSNFDNDVQMITLDMEFKTDDESDSDFIIDVLALGMIVEWLRPQVNNKLITMQMFGGKEQKFYSQSQHISELRGLFDDAKNNQRKIIRDRGYIYNQYLRNKS